MRGARSAGDELEQDLGGRHAPEPPRGQLPEPQRRRAEEFVRLQVEAIRRIIFPTHRL